MVAALAYDEQGSITVPGLVGFGINHNSCIYVRQPSIQAKKLGRFRTKLKRLSFLILFGLIVENFPVIRCHFLTQ